MEVNISNLNRFNAFYGNFAIYTDTVGRSGIINRQGEIVLRADEFEIATFIEGTTFAFQNTDGSRKEMTFDAATGEKKYTERPEVERKPMAQEYLVGPNRTAFQENGLFGIKDEKGNIIVPAQYTQMSSLGENIGFVHVKDQNGLSGIITTEGKPFIKCKYAYVVHKRATDTYKVKTPKGKFGLLNRHGNILIPARYDYIDVTDNLNEIAVKRGGKCFFINRKNEPIDLIEAWEYIDALPFFIEEDFYILAKGSVFRNDGLTVARNKETGSIVYVKGGMIVHELDYEDACDLVDIMATCIEAYSRVLGHLTKTQKFRTV